MFDFVMGYVMGERSAARAASMSRAAGASAGASTAGELHDLNDRIDRLLLVVDGLWSLLKESGYTDEQLATRIRRLDMEDGVADGKRTPKPTRCPACNAMVEVGRAACAFCGTPVTRDTNVVDTI